jgi:hypothetical protein
MIRASRIAIYLLLPCALVAGVTAGYEYRVGFPRTIAGRRVHRVTVWAADSYFQRERMYYAYTNADGKEAKHGPFQKFDSGHLVERADYSDGNLNGAVTFWNLFGDKTQEVYYVNGAPHGWANYMNGKLLSMRQDVLQDGHLVGAKSFTNGQYSLVFNCGELINAAIDPVSGQLTSIPGATKRACAEPSATSTSGTGK